MYLNRKNYRLNISGSGQKIFDQKQEGLARYKPLWDIPHSEAYA